MVKFIYSPQWFYGKDIIIDIVSIVVLLLIAFFSMRYYGIKKNRNYLHLAVSFAILAGSFLFKVIMNYNIYYKVIETKQLGLITVAFQALKASGKLFVTSFLLYWFFTLFGFYILYSIYQKQSPSNFLLGTYLLLVLSYFAYPAYYVFHLTLFVLLVLITLNHSRKYIKTRHFATKLVACSFGLIALSQVFFILVDVNSHFYVIGELVQLIGYIILLITFIMVLRYGRTQDKDRHHWRYAHLNP